MKYAPTIQRKRRLVGEVKRSSWLQASTSRNWLWFRSKPASEARFEQMEEYDVVDRQEVVGVAGDDLLGVL